MTQPDRSGPPAIVWNTLTGVLLASTLCACAYITLVFFNPRTALNPFPPPTRTPWPTPVIASSTPAGARVAPTLPPARTATVEGAAGGMGGGLEVASSTPAILPTTAPATPAPVQATPLPSSTLAASAATVTATATPSLTPTPAGPTSTAAGTEGYPGDGSSPTPAAGASPTTEAGYP